MLENIVNNLNVLVLVKYKETVSNYKNRSRGISLAIWWLRLHASTARDTGLISGQGTKIPHAGSFPQGKTCQWLSAIEWTLLIYFFKYNWSAVALQCCVSFRCAAKLIHSELDKENLNFNKENQFNNFHLESSFGITPGYCDQKVYFLLFRSNCHSDSAANNICMIYMILGIVNMVFWES